ncbi:VOC family protein [Actinomadura adrarensis]|uniref:VOC family protein n=1 Tax=Actinomadura adrarensis TaxID=1819600 RepID=A0ABW3CHY6_9ACTN
MGSPVAWFDLAAADPAAARKFYAELFDWDVTVVEDMNYGLVDTGSDEGIAGGIGESDGANPAGITMYVAVDDADGFLRKVEDLGGTTLTQPYEIPGVGHMAVFQDPEGNRVGLWQR